MEEIEGSRKNTFCYYHEVFKYHVDKRLKATYRCATRRTTGCSGLAIVNDDGKVYITNTHNHPPNDMEIRMSALRKKMYILCEETQQSIKSIFDDVCEDDMDAAKHISFAIMKSCLYKRRARHLPKIPDALSCAHPLLTDHFMYKNIYKGSAKAEDGSVALFFSSNELLVALNSSSEIYVDGTFSIVPRFPKIAQLYSIHIRVQDTAIATMFILCESRTVSIYRAICAKIIELVPHAQERLKFIMGDYEKAATAAFTEYFPNADIRGCWFHFNQAILRKWRQLKLKDAPKTLITMAMSVPLLPHTYFKEAFGILQQEADNMCDMYPDTLYFMSYMRKSWLCTAQQVSVYERPARTNNLVESFHNTIRKVIGTKHPSFWIFMDKLKKIISTQGIDLGRVNNNLQVRRPRSHVNCKRNTFIIKKQRDLLEGRISTVEFLKSFMRYTDEQQYFISVRCDESEGVVENICADLQSTILSSGENEP